MVPPPPTPVALHASQHEEGGADELSIEGLPGRAADDQTPITHASNHMNDGIDRLDVTNLPGILSQGQHPENHAASHKIGGSDLISVHALPGASDLELVARKGAASGYAGLGANAYIPTTQLGLTIAGATNFHALRLGQSWGPVEPITLKALTAPTHITDNAEYIILDTSEGVQPDGTDYHVPIDLFLYSTVGANILTVEFQAGSTEAALTYVSRATFPIAAGAAIRFARADLRGQKTSGVIQGGGISFSSMETPEVITLFPTLFVMYINTATFLRVTAKLTDPGTTTDLWVQAAAIHKRAGI